MKVKVCVERWVEIEIDNPIINKLVEFHRADPHNIASAEEYEDAVKCIEKATGIPAYDSDTLLVSEYIVCACAEDNTVIFEC